MRIVQEAPTSTAAMGDPTSMEPKPHAEARRDAGMTFSDSHQVLPSRMQHLGAWSLLGIVAVGDAANFYVALATLSGESLWIVGILTFALTAAAVALMHNAGHMARDIRARKASHGWRRVALQIGAWLLLGLGAFYLRMLEAIEDASGSAGAFGGDTTEAVSVWTTVHGALAVLMLAVYVAGGAIAYAVGYSTHNPARAAYFRARSNLRKAERRRNRTEAQLAKVDRRIQVLSPATDEVFQAQVARLEAKATELRLHRQIAMPVRMRMAQAERLQVTGDQQLTLADVDEAIRNKELEQKALRTVLAASETQARAKADEMRQYVRLRMAAAHGDPATTSALGTTNHSATTTV